MGLCAVLFAMALSQLQVTSAREASVTTVFSFTNNNTFFENLAVRANDKILATRPDVPELWSIDPDQKTGHLLLSISTTEALLGITEVGFDTFFFVSTNLTLATISVAPNTSALWQLSFQGCTPKVKLFTELPQVEFPTAWPLGMTGHCFWPIRQRA
jgi:hypothetical protein